jgi:hypothetical protein
MIVVPITIIFDRAHYALPVAELAFSNQRNECVAHFFDTESLNQPPKLLLNLACHRREQFGGNCFPFLLPPSPAVRRRLHGSLPIPVRLFDASHI